MSFSGLSDQDIEDLLQWTQVGFTVSGGSRECLFSPEYLRNDLHATSCAANVFGRTARQNQATAHHVRTSVSSMSSPQQSGESSFEIKSATRRKIKDDEPLVKRARHNVIKKRYRENLNNRFARLAETLDFNDRLSSGDDRKPRKKTDIFSGAISRIEELQARNQSLRRKIEREDF